MFGSSHLYHLSVALLSLLWSVEPEPSTQAQGLVSAAWWTNWREDFPVYDGLSIPPLQLNLFKHVFSSLGQVHAYDICFCVSLSGVV